VRANVNGYIENIYFKVGDYVQAGKLLYTIKTKEADALGNYSMDDSVFAFKGKLNIKAPSSGIVTEVLKLQNDYVADGDALATIADQSSFVFVLNVPYELNKYTTPGTVCNIMLADSTRMQGTILSTMPVVDAVSQTQNYILKPNTNKAFPENLLATVQIVKKAKMNTQALDKACLLTDETMENYWVMKLINDSTAVKIPVTTGIKNDDEIEILSPRFDTSDRIINSGNYGLPDTAFVNIIQP
ncbi:MAG: HlyD family efflux transporter periplasmic adaptor subunit, partial [Chitinophagia bacterium]|nr:HlyD family efflux transporter periplasmic adaptor subunit [Chitinophagia bacterium]